LVKESISSSEIYSKVNIEGGTVLPEVMSEAVLKI
jgi:hypothetical protein